MDLLENVNKRLQERGFEPLNHRALISATIEDTLIELIREKVDMQSERHYNMLMYGQEEV